MTTGDVSLVHYVQLDECLHCAYWQCHKDVKIASEMFILDETQKMNVEVQTNTNQIVCYRFYIGVK